MICRRSWPRSKTRRRLLRPLLTDIRTVFDRYGTDRLRTRTELIPALAGLEDNLWSEWTGLEDAAAPHVVTTGDIGRLLRPFNIRSKTIWPPQRRQGTKSESGYYRCQFEAAWGLLLRTKRHTATHEQNQVLVEIVNRHMPATATTGPARGTSPRRSTSKRLSRGGSTRTRSGRSEVKRGVRRPPRMSQAGPPLEQCDVLVVSHRLIQGRPAKSTVAPNEVMGIKRRSGPLALRFVLRPALGLRPPFRFGAVPGPPRYSPSWIAHSSERVAALVQAPPPRLGR
jgi:hypothetical protein